MSYQQARSNNQRKRLCGRTAVILLAVVMVCSTQGQAFAGETGALVRSLLIPGLGQAHQGHYTRASIYAGCAVVSGFGLILAQVHYRAAVDKYDGRKDTYAALEQRLASGEIVGIDEINAAYTDLDAAWNEADDRYAWRNAFLVAFLATYTVNLVDVILSKPYKIDPDERLAIDVGRDGFLS